MASWILVPSLTSLREEFNELAPTRDKGSDGSIGDAAHASSSSDHNPDETGATPYEDADSVNEVHAIDVDKDLNKSGWSMTKAVGIIVTRHRTGQDDRLQNVIWNGLIWSRSWGWTAREYDGQNPHDKHAHFSARYTSAEESDTRPWGLLEEDMPTAEEIADATALKLHQDLSNPASGLYRSLPERVADGLFVKRPLALQRVADRGWGGTLGMSVAQMVTYDFEALVAGGSADVDDDGDTESISAQSRLERLEDDVRALRETAERIEAALAALASPPPQG